jgi:threonine synthase
MRVSALRCTNCGREYEPPLGYRCERCGSPLTLVYESERAPAGGARWDGAGEGLWRWHAALPDVAPANRVSLGEGDTPLVHARRIGAAHGLDGVFVKSEGVNPTGSFKDRPTAVGVSTALELGMSTVVASSTGNAGASLAAYAARAGLRAVVVASATSPDAKVAPIVSHGAQVVRIGGSVSHAAELAHTAALRWGWLNVTSTFLNPYTVEGNKTVAYELAAQLGRAPDYVVVPVGVGPLLVGIHRGFRELQRWGIVDRVPRMVAVQAARCAPIARAFERGEDVVGAWHGPYDTVAGGIADPLHGYERDATFALRVVRASGGVVLACSEREIVAATLALAEDEGIFSEPTGAAAIAALAQLRERCATGPDTCVVCLATGHGLKDPAALADALKPIPTTDATLAGLERALAANQAAVA